MMSSHSPRIFRQRAQAIALLVGAVLAVATITIAALDAKSTSAHHAAQRVSAIAQAIGGVVLFAKALVFGWPAD
jgi:hypothetical protein